MQWKQVVRCQKIKFLIFTLLFFAGFSHGTPKTIKLVTFPIPLMVESETKGLFIDLVRAIEADTGLKFDIEVWPTPRALQQFSDKNFDILFPGLDTLFADPDQIIAGKELLYIKQDYVFTRADKPLIKSMAELKGLSIGLTRAYPYARSITQNKNLHLIYVNTDEQNAHMLKRNRIDAFIVEESSGLQAFKNIGHSDAIHYPKAHPISQQDVYFSFQKSALGVELEHVFSEALSKLKQSGEFKRIMSGAVKTGIE